MSSERLLDAIARELAGWSVSQLRRAAQRVSEAYEAADRRGVPPRLDAADRAAYVLMRMPATAAALGHVVGTMSARLGAFVPATVLDLGAGPGTFGWVVRARFGDAPRLTSVEGDAGFIAIGERMSGGARGRWIHTDLARATDFAPHDLVAVSYVLGELAPAAADRVVDAAWAATRKVLIVVEPGTPGGTARVLRARGRGLAGGARVIAPCPHGDPCPMRSPEWCHFAVRLARTRIQRLAKGGALGWEDEKFSYVVLARGDGHPAWGRLVGHPRRETGRVSLRLCAEDGLHTGIVTKQHNGYRAARHAAWGDEWPAGPDSGMFRRT